MVAALTRLIMSSGKSVAGFTELLLLKMNSPFLRATAQVSCWLDGIAAPEDQLVIPAHNSTSCFCVPCLIYDPCALLELWAAQS